MPTLLVYLPAQNGAPTKTSLEVLTRARAVAASRGMTLAAAVLAADPAPLAAEAARYGAPTVYTVASDVFAETTLNPSVVAALAAVIDAATPSVVAMPSSEGVKEVLGALAARTGAAAIPDVAAFDVTAEGGAVEALRPVMAAKFLARTRAEAPLVFVSVRAGSYAAEEAPVVSGTVPVEMPVAETKQTLREVVQAVTGTVDLSEANVVVAAGRGVKDAAGKALVEELARVTGGAIGASRAVVESGLFPASAQIGQTGKVVSPEVYFAVGISGAIQHVAGMANSRVVVALNRDADAPIFESATYGVVGDLYETLPALIAEIKRAKGL